MIIYKIAGEKPKKYPTHVRSGYFAGKAREVRTVVCAWRVNRNGHWANATNGKLASREYSSALEEMFHFYNRVDARHRLVRNFNRRKNPMSAANKREYHKTVALIEASSPN